MKRLSGWVGLAILVGGLLTGCGGGDSGSGAPATPPAAAVPPVVSMLLDSPRAVIGTSVKVSWSATNAVICTGLDTLTGIKPTNGSEAITPKVLGPLTLTLSCEGPGGVAKQSVVLQGVAQLRDPLPPQATSYLNFKNINIGPQVMPSGIGFVTNETVAAGHGYGDFFKDGSIAMLAATNVLAAQNGFGSTVSGRIYFFQKDPIGNWVDKSSTLLGPNDRTGCISPRKVVVADFNGDKRPDAFVSCSGIDGNIPDGFNSGEEPRFILSQADGTYKNTGAGFKCSCFGAAAADFKGDGFADLVFADPPTFGRVVYMKNNRTGTFTDTPSLIPASTRDKTIWAVEFVDVNQDAKFDLALFGFEDDVSDGQPAKASEWPPTFFINDGSNVFSDAVLQVRLPFVKGLVRDVIVQDSKIVLMRSYSSSQLQIQVYAYPSLALTVQYFEPDRDTAWFTLFNGQISEAYTRSPFTHPL